MNEELDDALVELRRQHREIEPPPFLETRLRAAATNARPMRLRWWIPALAAALILAAVILWPTKPAEVAIEQNDFVIVPGSEGLPAPMATSILQVDLPRAELRQYGFNEPPTTDQRIRMDFIVGDDGLARAIRIAGPIGKGIQ